MKLILVKVCVILMALAIPTIVFYIMGLLLNPIIKSHDNVTPFYIILCLTTSLLLYISFLMTDKKDDLIALLGAIVGAGIVAIPICLNLFTLSQEDICAIAVIAAWVISVIFLCYCLFPEQKSIVETPKEEVEDNTDLIGGWYKTDSNQSWLPIIVFDKNHIATFSDGKIVEEYEYKICCSTAIVLKNNNGEKKYCKRIWVKNKPHIYFNDMEFTQDGKHAE